MKDPAQKRFHIVRFTSTLPYVACNRYQCIPRTWIKDHYKWMSMDEAIAVIYYPDKPVKNMWYLKNMKKHEESWKEFIVDIVYSSDNYEDAKINLKRTRKETFRSTKKGSNGVSENMSTGTDVVLPSRRAQRSYSGDVTPKHERTSKLILKLPKQSPKKVLINRVDVGENCNVSSSDNNDIVLKKLDSIEVIFKDAKNSLFRMKTDLDKQSKLSRKIFIYLKSLGK